jgi:hypothetical protein
LAVLSFTVITLYHLDFILSIVFLNFFLFFILWQLPQDNLYSHY